MAVGSGCFLGKVPTCGFWMKKNNMCNNKESKNYTAKKSTSDACMLLLCSPELQRSLNEPLSRLGSWSNFDICLPRWLTNAALL